MRVNTVDLRNYVLDSIPELKNLYINNFNENTYVHLDTVFILGGEEEITPKFPITIDQLSSVFENTNKERLAEVVKAINKYSNKFEINSVERMSHFLGQIGHESGGFMKLDESTGYTGSNIYNIVLKPNLRSNSQSNTGKTFKYCDVISGYTAPNSCEKGYLGHKNCDKILSVELTSKGKTKWNYNDFNDKGYSIKQNHIGKANLNKLYDYWYGCRMGNGSKGTREGSRYKGKGFIQITGKDTYQKVYNEWKKSNLNVSIEDFMKKLTSDVDVAIEASMCYWKHEKLNEKADVGMDDYSIERLGTTINGSRKKKPNGWEHRLEKTQGMYNILKK